MQNYVVPGKEQATKLFLKFHVSDGNLSPNNGPPVGPVIPCLRVDNSVPASGGIQQLEITEPVQIHTTTNSILVPSGKPIHNYTGLRK